MPKWARDFLVLPLIVGVVIAAITVGVPLLLKERSQLSYEIDGPTRYLDDPATRGVEIAVNGTPVTDLVAYRVRLWNSGDRPITSLPVRIGFDEADPGFLIFAASHLTTPRHEFGEIDELESGDTYRRYSYALLNPGDQDIVTLLTNSAARIEVFSKAEGLQVERRDSSADGWLGAWAMEGLPMFVGFLSVVAVLFSQLLVRLKMDADTKIDALFQRLFGKRKKPENDG